MNNAERTKDTIMLAKERGKFVDNITYDDAIEALDKQIEMKAEETDAYPHRLFCPRCYKTLMRNKERLKEIKSWELLKYCPYCGQKIDWSDE